MLGECFCDQVAASPSATVVAAADLPAEELERERAIELQKEDILSKPEAIRCVMLALSSMHLLYSLPGKF